MAPRLVMVVRLGGSEMLQVESPRRWVVAGVAAIMLLASCGTRVPGEISALHSERLSGGGGFGATSLGGSVGNVSGRSSVSASGQSSASGVPVGAAGAASGSASSAGASSGRLGGIASNVGSASNTAAPGATVVVGEIGNWSGVFGSAYAPARDAFGAWASWVNAHGGVLGHPIKVLVADDNNDTANDVSDAQTMVEQGHAIALVNAFPAGGDITAIAQYAQQKNIPVIGGSATGAPWNQNPVMFPTSSNIFGTWLYDNAKAMAQSNVHKVGSVYCIEATGCHTSEQAIMAYARQLGMEVVYEGGISLTQPDYTAQCLQAQSAGAQAVYVDADDNSTIRFANSCHQQGYEPLIVAAAPGAVAPSLEGSIAVNQAFPWMLTSGTPALEEYGQAIASYDHNPTDGQSTLGWNSGKLLQKVLEIALSRSPVPSTAGLFEALWSLRNETLGGLTPPFSFYQGRPATETRCSYEVKVSNGHWTAPYGPTATLCEP